MAKVYSETDDVFDPLIQGITQDEDQEEAGRVIERELRKRGIDPALVTSEDGIEYLRRLSVLYASLYRCRLSMSDEGDSYHVRVVDLKEQWQDALDEITYEGLLGKIPDSTGTSLLGSVSVKRG
ncbi:MAG: hypothetical protein ACWGQW_14235 [bacterium]